MYLKDERPRFSLPARALSLAADADADDLRVLLFLGLSTENGEDADAPRIAKALGLSEAAARSALKFWRGAGFLQEDAPQKEKTKSKPGRKKTLPHLSASALAELGESDAVFRAFVDLAQETAGWIFNENEIAILASLYRDLGLSTDYILELIAYLVCEKEKPLRYVERVAYDLALEKEIRTPQALEEWIAARQTYEGGEGIVRKLFGLGARKLSEKEQVMVASWFADFGYGEPMIALAYEKTVNATGKASIAYANAILTSWHNSGCKTPEEVAAHGEEQTAPQSFDVGAAFENALNRSYQKKDGDQT
ncbi:MAG: DnaD domain protein [Clostridia bacterium]|nr:DnaD domain protein [Clostridia bacterium]